MAKCSVRREWSGATREDTCSVIRAEVIKWGFKDASLPSTAGSSAGGEQRLPRSEGAWEPGAK